MGYHISIDFTIDSKIIIWIDAIASIIRKITFNFIH